jgi:hypothetical protein
MRNQPRRRAAPGSAAATSAAAPVRAKSRREMAALMDARAREWRQMEWDSSLRRRGRGGRQKEPVDATCGGTLTRVTSEVH